MHQLLVFNHLVRNFSQKICKQCKISSPLQNLYNHPTTKDNKYRICKKCLSHNYSSPDKIFERLLQSSKSHNKCFLEKGKAFQYSITLEMLQKRWDNQEGKCYYSSIPMSKHSFSNWQGSLERLNPNKGYTAQNTALVCLEFNGAKQWSKEKIAQIPILIQSEVNKHDLQEIILKAKDYPAIKRSKKKSIYSTKSEWTKRTFLL